jgi:Na+/H+ antiporter NhaD/arsenite permease-like protein
LLETEMSQPDLLTSSLPLWSALPFVGMVLAIAILPLLFERWWQSNLNKAIVAVALGSPVALFFAVRDAARLGHTTLEYGAFVCLLGVLFIISGGIHVRGGPAGTPLSNTVTLAIGAVIANAIGTTGASMLLIRPLLRANEHRRHRAHVVIFFIFIVSNIGGCLTPLGDPPLFLGFLRGVPFEWTLRLWPEWLFTAGALLVIFNLLDQYQFNREELAYKESLMDLVQPERPIEIEGKVNFLLLLCVVIAVFVGGRFVYPQFGDTVAKTYQIAAAAVFSVISLLVTPRRVRYENRFTWHPIVEVAVLFAGIFATMIPALLLLEQRGAELGVSQPWQYFWATGGLSSFLDNAPTYLTFWSLAQYLPNEVAGTTHRVLAAISCGAVFMGANTYIGNGPNFMVRSIAEQSGVRMPSFFGYMAWAAAILLPLFICVTLIFFRG